MTSTPDTTPTWFRGFIQGKTRIVFAWGFAVLLVLCSRSYPTWPGVLLCFVGAAIRFWGSGFLRKDSKLAIGGPYRFVRNPLYLGTYLMAIGTLLSTENWVLFIVLSFLFALIYHYIILDEEIKLKRLFGIPYEKYLTLVPRFFPFKGAANLEQLRAVNAEPDAPLFSWEVAMKNKAYEAFVSFALLMGFVTLMAWVWGRFYP